VTHGVVISAVRAGSAKGCADEPPSSESGACRTRKYGCTDAAAPIAAGFTQAATMPSRSRPKKAPAGGGSAAR
jgi:hypothetical protein